MTQAAASGVFAKSNKTSTKTSKVDNSKKSAKSAVAAAKSTKIAGKQGKSGQQHFMEQMRFEVLNGAVERHDVNSFIATLATLTVCILLQQS
jgi:hypothetical protein